ncbi:MAG: peroxiredoxin [Magnetovibrionaceae bacterium]
MTITVGDTLPSVTLTTMTDEGPEGLAVDEFFKGKKVALFGLPGAFTPTCSAKHVPGYMEKAAELKAKGVDAIACISVNDAFVMGAWAKDQGTGDTVIMLADGSAEFTKAAGLELDLTARGLGVRSQRFSMIVDDGKVSALDIEPNPGELNVSSAEKMLEKL